MTSSISLPKGATALIVLEQFSHLDWDWLNSFPQNCTGEDPYDAGYFGGNRQPANVIYSQAHDLLAGSADYTYATCEMGFLQAFGNAYPQLLQEMVATGRLRIIGGGITSPDSLLSHGETFIRNFVVGLQWMQSVGLPWTQCVWLPDDFGHDSQLPATLAAMGAIAVGFARCPLAAAYQGNMTDDQPAPTAGTILYQPPSDNGGCDFFWQAADGSTVFAHWMPDAYSQGSSLYNPALPWITNANATIAGYLQQNQGCSPTPYVHVPVADDFYVPLGGGQPPIKVQNTMLNDIAAWNQSYPTTPAVLSTFDQYVAAVLDYVNSGAASLETRTFHGSSANIDATTFRSNPYWMGFYASRMNLKTGHHQATRLLLAAETLDAILATQGIALSNATADLLAAWAQLVPSTHHDYITGTAEDVVVDKEQQPLLDDSATSGQTLMTSQLAALAAALNPPSNALVVFNPVGAPCNGGLVEITSDQVGELSLPEGQSQTAAGGGVLVYVSAPSAGYQTFVNDYPATPAAPACTTNDGGKTWTLANGIISATVAQSANWALTGVIDLASKQTFVKSGNQFSFYSDLGNIYEFGFECKNSGTFTALNPQVTTGSATQTESGPLRVTLSASITVSGETYTLQYSLVAGEPLLRMTVIGQAPSGTSMLASFTFDDQIAGITHGTPNHWDYKTPATFGSQSFNSVFEPVHDFIQVYNGTNALMGAIYPQAVPAWAIAGNSLVAAIMRNTPASGCDGRGAQGGDNRQHTIQYALRVPTGLGAPGTGQPIAEARGYNTPLFGTIASPSSGTASLQLSLASVVAPSPAMITAAKRGTFNDQQLFIRVYQPANANTVLKIACAVPAGGAGIATALEQLPTQGPQPVVSADGNIISFTTKQALTTIQLNL